MATFNAPFATVDFVLPVYQLVLLFLRNILQKQLETAFEGLDSIAGIADDTFVYGSSEEEHDRNLIKLMERAKKRV